MSKTIKIIYYVDSDDNTKGSLMAYPSDKDLRDFNTIEEIANTLVEANFGYKNNCESIAWEIAHIGCSETLCRMGKYEFGIEETELFE